MWHYTENLKNLKKVRQSIADHEKCLFPITVVVGFLFHICSCSGPTGSSGLWICRSFQADVTSLCKMLAFICVCPDSHGSENDLINEATWDSAILSWGFYCPIHITSESDLEIAINNLSGGFFLWWLVLLRWLWPLNFWRPCPVMMNIPTFHVNQHSFSNKQSETPLLRLSWLFSSFFLFSLQ